MYFFDLLVLCLNTSTKKQCIRRDSQKVLPVLPFRSLKRWWNHHPWVVKKIIFGGENLHHMTITTLVGVYFGWFFLLEPQVLRNHVTLFALNPQIDIAVKSQSTIIWLSHDFHTNKHHVNVNLFCSNIICHLYSLPWLKPINLAKILAPCADAIAPCGGWVWDNPGYKWLQREAYIATSKK